MQNNPLEYRVWENKRMKHYSIRGGVFMRSTDIWDVQGKKIYEGDVVMVNNLFDYSDIKYVKVQYDKKRMGWNLGEYKTPGRVFVVVGHIFERKKWP